MAVGKKIGVFVGTVYGGAEEVAEAAVEKLVASGHDAQLYPEPQFDDFIRYRENVVLVVTSTTGEGEIPDNLMPLYLALNEQFPQMPELNYGVIALGDLSYGEERFCGGGRQVDELLQQLQAKPLIPILRVDACVNFDALEVAMPWLDEFVSRLG
ncbi:flavodoxin [Photobacterium sp. J15]|uniref:flavodoxin n=1 Tax=Photobacterium sp. J15 TaxID=265901 RepID=UPI0007E4A1E8|nr:flavodoxin [Photobacterium sp. J15]